MSVEPIIVSVVVRYSAVIMARPFVVGAVSVTVATPPDVVAIVSMVPNGLPSVSLTWKITGRPSPTNSPLLLSKRAVIVLVEIPSAVIRGGSALTSMVAGCSRVSVISAVAYAPSHEAVILAVPGVVPAVNMA